MVTIKFYQDPVKSECIERQFETLMHCLSESSFSKESLLDLRFFYDEILGEEVDQSDLSFLDISKGTIAITFDSMVPRGPETWVYLAIAAVVAVATILLVPKIPTLSRDQGSATNSFGLSVNEPRIGDRIDDIFGTVTKHTPPLWQVPYRIGVNNQEAEVLLLAIGRGKYLLDTNTIYDGDTRIIDIPNAQFSKYEPNTYPSNGLPSLQIGEDINEKIGVYRQSNDLNPSELLPPNDLVNSNLKWKLSGSGPNGIMVATFIPDDFNFAEYYKVDDVISLKDLNYFIYDKDVTIYGGAADYTEGPSTFKTYYQPIDLGEEESIEYVITNVTADSITVLIPANASAQVVSAWSSMTDYIAPTVYYKATNNSLTDFYALRGTISTGDWFEDDQLSIPVNISDYSYSPLVGKPFTGTLGPFVVPVNSDEIILNFVSESGFYKLKSNNETPVTAEIKILVEEIDIYGVITGNKEIHSVPYTSNQEVRKSVFKTERIAITYAKSVVSAVRTTSRDKSKEVSNVDIIKWRDLYSFENVSNLELGDVTLAHVIIPSNSQSRLIKERKQNMNVTRLITEYLGDGVFGPGESLASDDFSQILIHVSLDPFIGRLKIEDINADGFLSLSNQITEYFNSNEMTRFGYDFDNTQVTYQDIFIQICKVVNCSPYVQNGIYDASFERLQESSSMQITCRNKIEGSESREQIFTREFDGIEVSYRDEATSISETIYLPSDRSSVNPDRLELNGCVTRLQAFRYAYREFNKQIYSKINVNFDVDEFGRNIIPNRRIDSPDSTRFTYRDGVTDGYKIYDGEVIESNGLTVELSEPVTFTENEDHYIVFTKLNGDNSEHILCTRIDDFTVLLSELPSESIYDGYSKDKTKYTFASEQLRESIALIPKTIEFKVDDEGNEINTIGSINYSDQYYKNDLEFPL